MSKPKFAFYWCASCGGCEEAVIDLNEKILDLTAAVDIVFWPVAMDFKYKDIRSMKKEEIDVCFINGAIRTAEQKEMALLLRKKSKIVIAFGSCAHLGGIPGLANFWRKRDIFERVYENVPTVKNPEHILPKVESEVDGYKLNLPEFYDTVNALDQVIPVDYYLPGCPPAPKLITDAIDAILKNKLPEKGSVLAPDKALCDTCPLVDSKPDKLSIKEIKRPHEIKIDPEKCFLTQGLICLGPVTRSGCGECCINANMPCRGCMGPTKAVMDQGAKAISFIASILGVENEENMSDEDVQALINQIVDPAGTFYRFSLPYSLLKKKR